MSKLKWGILSTASIAQKQIIPAIKRSTNAEVVAIASRSDKVYELAEKFNIPNAYESYEELLDDPSIDVIYIPLPNRLHKEWIIKAARAGKHVMTEKPATLTAEEAREIEKVSRECQVMIMEGYMYQFHAQHQRVRNIIESGEIGDIRLMKVSHTFYLDQEKRKTNIRLNSSLGGGSIYDLGCYCIHSIRNILQTEPAEVQAFAQKPSNDEVDMSSVVYMSMENGVKAIFDCSFDMNQQQQYSILGTQGTITVPRAFRPDKFGGEGIIIIEKENEKRVEKLVTDQYVAEVDYFSNCILEGKNLTLDDTIKNMEAIDACYESIGENKKVVLYNR